LQAQLGIVEGVETELVTKRTDVEAATGKYKEIQVAATMNLAKHTDVSGPDLTSRLEQFKVQYSTQASLMPLSLLRIPDTVYMGVPLFIPTCFHAAINIH
jgi:hypothetical protein